MTEKIITVDKRILREKIGILTDGQMLEISRQIASVLFIRKEDLD